MKSILIICSLICSFIFASCSILAFYSLYLLLFDDSLIINNKVLFILLAVAEFIIFAYISFLFYDKYTQQ